MSSIIDELKRKSFFYCEKGASIAEIKTAEDTLGIQFADDYRSCLIHYGAVSCGGHELTGISKDMNLDVVKVTIQNRKRNPSADQHHYVIEETHMDGIVVWQASSGEVYQTEYKGAPRKIYESLEEYVYTFDNCSMNE